MDLKVMRKRLAEIQKGIETLDRQAADVARKRAINEGAAIECAHWIAELEKESMVTDPQVNGEAVRP